MADIKNTPAARIEYPWERQERIIAEAGEQSAEIAAAFEMLNTRGAAPIDETEE